MSDREKSEAANLAGLWERSKHKDAQVSITVLDETDDNGRIVYEVQIIARGTLPLIASQYDALI